MNNDEVVRAKTHAGTAHICCIMFCRLSQALLLSIVIVLAVHIFWQQKLHSKSPVLAFLEPLWPFNASKIDGGELPSSNSIIDKIQMQSILDEQAPQQTETMQNNSTVLKRSNDDLNKAYEPLDDSSIFAIAMIDMRVRTRFNKVFEYRDMLVNEAIVNNLGLRPNKAPLGY